MIRIIARLDIKGAKLIKGVQLEGVRVIGDPWEYAQRYYREGIDELLYVDAVASLYGRSGLIDLLSTTVRNLFVPVTAGGGVRNVDDAAMLLQNGADKVAINTAAVHRPKLIREVADRFGSQSVVVSIQAKHRGGRRWEAYTECGREHSGRDAVEWAQEAADSGAGEILLTSIDNDGTFRGFDLELLKAISPTVSIPVIVSGGLGKPSDFVRAIKEGQADAVAIGSALHYRRTSIAMIRECANTEGVPVRNSELTLA